MNDRYYLIAFALKNTTAYNQFQDGASADLSASEKARTGVVQLKNLIILFLITAGGLFGCDIKNSDSMQLVSKPETPQPGGQGNNPPVVDEDEKDDPNTRPEEQFVTFDFLKRTALSSCVRCHA